MNARIYTAVFLAVSLIVLVLTGCSSFIQINERAMLVEDIINMTEAGVGKDVIIRQIEVTRSRFELDADQIVMLKKAGVDDEVIEAMIETEAYPDYYNWEYGYSPYEYGSHYYNQWYPVSTHYPYIYQYMYPYTTYRRADFIGRFYRYAPITYPPYQIYNRRYDWRYPERRDKDEDDD